MSKIKSDWYTTQLRALQEPSLLALKKNPTVESYRFLWLRSFHQPIAIRLDLRSDGSALLTIKIGSGAGGYRPESIRVNTARVLTTGETQAFRTKVQTLNFWELPSEINDEPGDDGSQWVIEGVKNGQYHLVDRWSPRKGPIRELGAMMVFELAKITIPEKEIY